MSLTLATPTTQITEDETFTIHGLSWDQYVAINDALGDQAGLRTLFLHGKMTFRSPARRHEWSEHALDSIIKAITVGCAIDMDVVGSTTLRKEGLATGLEGNCSYYLRDNVALMGGPGEIDLAIHPPPDLAVEVENSNKADESLAIYACLGVPEVWRHDVRRGTLDFLALRPGGTYASQSTSLNFPFLQPDDVLDQLRVARETRSHTRWAIQLADWVRDVILPRLADQP